MPRNFEFRGGTPGMCAPGMRGQGQGSGVRAGGRRRRRRGPRILPGLRPPQVPGEKPLSAGGLGGLFGGGDSDGGFGFGDDDGGGALGGPSSKLDAWLEKQARKKKRVPRMTASFVVPEDARPGQAIHVEVGGQIVVVVIPEDAEPGAPISVEVPPVTFAIPPGAKAGQPVQVEVGGVLVTVVVPPDGQPGETVTVEIPQLVERTFEVPPDAAPGDVVEIELPNGETFTVIVPEDAVPGEPVTMKVVMPPPATPADPFGSFADEAARALRGQGAAPAPGGARAGYVRHPDGGLVFSVPVDSDTPMVRAREARRRAREGVAPSPGRGPDDIENFLREHPNTTVGFVPGPPGTAEAEAEAAARAAGLRRAAAQADEAEEAPSEEEAFEEEEQHEELTERERRKRARKLARRAKKKWLRKVAVGFDARKGRRSYTEEERVERNKTLAEDVLGAFASPVRFKGSKARAAENLARQQKLGRRAARRRKFAERPLREQQGQRADFGLASPRRHEQQEQPSPLPPPHPEAAHSAAAGGKSFFVMKKAAAKTKKSRLRSGGLAAAAKLAKAARKVAGLRQTLEALEPCVQKVGFEGKAVK